MLIVSVLGRMKIVATIDDSLRRMDLFRDCLLFHVSEAHHRQ
jgi:hypothetical protein